MRVIAELGTNTGGDLTRALAMVDAAAEAGADGVKVQMYEVGDFLPEGHPDWDMFETNRLLWDEIEFVQKQVIQNGLLFGATPTSHFGVKRLKEMRVDFLKNGSDFLLRHDLIDAMVATGIETWVSTGMATQAEVDAVPAGANLMACTSLYPCPQHLANVARLADGKHTGYSDHTRCTLTAPLCVALGADMYETHFTLDAAMKGPDHSFSRTPDDFSLLVSAVRTAETLMGSGLSEPAERELEGRNKWRVTEETLRS